MFSLIKKMASSFGFWSTDSVEDDPNETERILAEFLELSDAKKEKIQQMDENIQNVTEEQKPLGQSDLEEYDVKLFKCIHRNGKVTHLTRECGLIDGVIYFEPNQVEKGSVIKVNDEVNYSAYKVRENEMVRVYKVYPVKNDVWEYKDCDANDSQKENVAKDEDLHAISRVITGRVTQRKGREVYIESADIWCNLDKIQASFIPIQGDWVEINASVSVNPETVNLVGDILEVTSLKPLLVKSGFGRVTFWSNIKKDGAIENLIYFSSISCEEGYIPSLGDEVVYDAVESDQDGFRWRALKVFFNNSKSESNNNKSEPVSQTSSTADKNILFNDKNGVTIKPAICSLEVEFNKTKTVTLEVTNSGTVKQLFMCVKFQTRKESQLTLLSPKMKNNFYIHPQQSVLYQFQCEGKYLGLTKEILYFNFKNFTIARGLEIAVKGDKEMDKLLECKMGTVFKVLKRRKKRKEVNPDVVFYGPKPWKPPKFIGQRRNSVFNIPRKLWDLTTNCPYGKEFLRLLCEYAPYLKNDLNYKEYADRFHTLLYLEEIEVKQNFTKYDMDKVFFVRNDKYFVLDVPGLVEKRPSLIIGDKVLVTQPWNDGGKAKHVGFIHDIRAREIFIKFHETFEETISGSECCVSFEPNTIFFSRCHDAVDRAKKTLGEQWLFPTAVNEKSPLVKINNPQIIQENANSFLKTNPKNQKNHADKKVDLLSNHFNQGETNIKPTMVALKDSEVKNLVWVNESLNERQKLAVVGVLEGRGRPLPYIIFGPPGTGKTVTLVETVIQIYRLIPESRILVTTPSNSAADLICERLIDAGQFKPGQLVRLVALYRIFEGLVSPKLLPYTTFFNPRGYLEKNMTEVFSRANIKGSTIEELVGRNRITIGTCVTIGMLHHSDLHFGHFSHILIDEAGQTSEPELLITASFQSIPSGQVILAGDPQQLGPVICSSLAKSFGLGVSLLERLISVFPYARDFDGFPKTSGFDPRFITILKVNYRSVPEILSLPSQLFYNSDLIPTVSQTEGEEAKIIQKFNFEVENRTTPPAVIFHGIVGQNYQEKDSPSWFNPHEIWQVVFYTRKLYNIGLNCSDIGIVSPYSKQSQKLKYLLSSLKMAQPKIGSVEEFQGQERQVIIVTTVRSCPKYVPSDITHSLGFVASPQRLNVALTRARALLIIIGNPFLLSRDPYWINVLRYCRKNNSYTGCGLDSIEDSLEPVNDVSGKEF